MMTQLLDEEHLGRNHRHHKTHPILGVGLGAFSVVYTGYDSRNGQFRLEQAHNDYLQVLSDGGIVGAALGLFFCY